MSTAIVILYVKHEGFVIAADGRRSVLGEPEVRDGVQKVFPIEGSPGTVLAYAFAGRVDFMDKSGIMLFNFQDEAKRVADSYEFLDSSGFGSYILKFARSLNEVLRNATKGHEVDWPVIDPKDPGFLATLALVGYYRRKPCRGWRSSVTTREQFKTKTVGTLSFVFHLEWISSWLAAQKRYSPTWCRILTQTSGSTYRLTWQTRTLRLR
jgi:hypothetical protein